MVGSFEAAHYISKRKSLQGCYFRLRLLRTRCFLLKVVRRSNRLHRRFYEAQSFHDGFQEDLKCRVRVENS